MAVIKAEDREDAADLFARGKVGTPDHVYMR